MAPKHLHDALDVIYGAKARLTNAVVANEAAKTDELLAAARARRAEEEEQAALRAESTAKEDFLKML